MSCRYLFVKHVENIRMIEIPLRIAKLFSRRIMQPALSRQQATSDTPVLIARNAAHDIQFDSGVTAKGADVARCKVRLLGSSYFLRIAKVVPHKLSANPQEGNGDKTKEG